MQKKGRFLECKSCGNVDFIGRVITVLKTNLSFFTKISVRYNV
jgi:hypothetical protein